MLVSLCLCTINRFDLTVQCVGSALARAGTPFEFLSVDNGSTDQIVIDYIRSLNPVYHRLNKTNLGYGPMMNQMFVRAEGDYICMIDNDLELPNDWLATLVNYNQAIPNSGICGIHTVEELYPVQEINGRRVHVGQGIFGVRLFNRRVIEKVGYLDEHFGVYGSEDRQYGFRVERSGFVNYYVPDLKCSHLGEDCGETSTYRQMKWTALYAGLPHLTESMARMEAENNYYLPPPKLDELDYLDV